jgi:hypothetical protein
MHYLETKLSDNMHTEEFIKKILESEDFKIFEEDGGAGNATANVDGYQTPNAFAKSEEDYEDHIKDRAEMFGYKMVGKSKHKHFKPIYKTESKSTYKQAMESLNEIRYTDYKLDDTRTANRKINDSIQSINRTIYEVESALEHALKLKTEMGVDQRTLWGSSITKLRKISERINRITKKIHELGA